MSIRYNLERFVLAQDEHDTYVRAIRELRSGRKSGHWMWFVFPQIAGLGQSEMARRYAITTLDEATAYLDHPTLGPRLVECAIVVRNLRAGSAEDIFGQLDARKLCSSMTLFMRARPAERVFEDVIARYFGGEGDHTTDERLRALGRSL